MEFYYFEISDEDREKVRKEYSSYTKSAGKANKMDSAIRKVKLYKRFKDFYYNKMAKTK